MNFHLGEKAYRGNKKVCSIGEYRKEKGEGEAVAEMGGDPEPVTTLR